MALVEISPPEFDVNLNLIYATEHNFTGAPIYRRAGCYLHADAAEALLRAISLAGEVGLGIRIYDAFRPAEAQWLMWSHTPDPEFLADPRRGSPHSRGVAVDLALTATNSVSSSMMKAPWPGFSFLPRPHSRLMII